MIVEYVRYRVAPERGALLEQAWREASALLRASPHCLAYELTRCAKDPARYVVRLEWDSPEGHLEGFRKSAAFAEFVAHVRPFIADIEEMEHYAPTGVGSRSTIFDAAGGVATFFRLAHEMHARMKADALLGPHFARAAESHVPHLAMWLVEVFGGPKLYSETLGDIAPILRRHAGLRIDDAQRERFVRVAADAAAHVVADVRAREAIVRYVAWGARVAQENSAPERVPNAQAGVPTWGWDDR
ncbi:antibiotic biosynthesis monooxygenase [Sandaracinus amylolyticus]|nr:antibiotic biosynthesis monooxygenase [Sandaracinus amylolyticus]